MTRPEDAVLLGALEAQLRELNYLGARLESMRSTLLPPPASFWRGAAGRVYELERSSLDGVIARGLVCVIEAREATASAVERVMSRV